MARPKNDRTKYEILQCATKLFLEKGYTDAYVTTIAKKMGIITGLLTFWFPTDESPAVRLGFHFMLSVFIPVFRRSHSGDALELLHEIAFGGITAQN